MTMIWMLTKPSYLHQTYVADQTYVPSREDVQSSDSDSELIKSVREYTMMSAKFNNSNLSSLQGEENVILQEKRARMIPRLWTNLLTENN